MEETPKTDNLGPAAEPEAKPEAKPETKRLAVGVQFRLAGKIYTFIANDSSYAAGDMVVVESDGGTALGGVIVPPYEPKEGQIPQNAKRVLHRASQQEIDEENARREKALDLFLVCQQKIRERDLPMKLVDAQIEEDGKKVVFIFFAEARVDFRGLVKDLAGSMHMRIEMRQIGSRDESKYKGCLGPCGLETCCSSHLRQFQSISISMAKHQGLAPNPAKLTGMCGKLKCCLAYEHAVYNEYRAGLPKIGSSVKSPEGPGKVIGHNVLKRECTVHLYGGGDTRCPCEKCEPMDAKTRDAAIEEARNAAEKNIERMRERQEKRRGGGNRDKKPGGKR